MAILELSVVLGDYNAIPKNDYTRHSKAFWGSRGGALRGTGTLNPQPACASDLLPAEQPRLSHCAAMPRW